MPRVVPLRSGSSSDGGGGGGGGGDGVLMIGFSPGGSLPDESRSQCSGQQSKSWTPLKLWETFTEDFEEILGSVLLGCSA